MAGLLADVFSFGDTAKRKVKGLLADPAGTLQQFVGNENDRAGRFNELNREAAVEWAQRVRSGEGGIGPKDQQLLGLLADSYNPTGMFIGATAKTWDKAAAEKAQKMLQSGADPKQVWKETGTFKGADGALRQEIPDNLATERAYNLTPAKAYEKARFDAVVNDSQPMRDRANSMAPYWQMPKKQLHEEYARTGGEIVDAALAGDKALAKKLMDDRGGLDALLSEMRSATYGPASSFLKHGELGKAYPDVYKLHTRISPDDLGTGVGGQYMREQPGIREQMIVRNKPTWEADKSTMLHEMQHAIQQREGWARGGSPENFNQQDVAKVARDALSWRNELLRLKKEQPNADISALEGILIQQYDELGAPDWIPPREARDLARQPNVLFPEKYPKSEEGFDDLTELVKAYGLDRRATPYSPNEAYRLLAGEAEARATQARMNMNAAQRREVYPFDSYDVPVDQLIVRGGLLGN